MPNSRMANAGLSGLKQRPCGIIRIAALCTLCRYRHNTHWSGSEKRLAREFGKRFGDRAYAAEELVAEIGAAFLCARIGIEGQLRHAEYIGSWIELLKDDPRAIFTAASKASQAADFLSSFSEANQNDDSGEAE